MSGARTTIVGGGAWGTALAVHLGRLGRSVRLWIREPDLVERMATRHDNPVYLPGVEVPRSVTPMSDLRAAVEGASVLFCVVPSPFSRAVYRQMAGALATDAALILGTKGIESETLALPSEVAEAEFDGRHRVAVISGPSFAAEVARGTPTALVVASSDRELAERVQDAVSGPLLRLYTNDDVVGVQLAGALKNVIAIAAGIVDGLGMGRNTQAALITRGLAEMRRLALARGGRAETFAGLAGLGDLVLTCTGERSRNRHVGLALAQGERLQDVLGTTRHVAEGVRTAVAALEMARRHGIEMPIVEEVHRILYEDAAPREAVERLMARPLTSEREPSMERPG